MRLSCVSPITDPYTSGIQEGCTFSAMHCWRGYWLQPESNAENMESMFCFISRLLFHLSQRSSYVDYCKVVDEMRFPRINSPSWRFSLSIVNWFSLPSQAMENLVDKGLCKAIGVSNFTTKKIKTLLETATIVPACNQGTQATGPNRLLIHVLLFQSSRWKWYFPSTYPPTILNSHAGDFLPASTTAWN